MSEGTALIIAALLSSPILMAIVTYAVGRWQRKEEWDRQDKVAARVKGVEETLASATANTDEKLDRIETQGIIIHGLVNSNMTEALLGQVAALTGQLAMMNEVADLKRAEGKEVNPIAVKAMEVIEEKIEVLHQTLADREKAQEAARAAGEANEEEAARTKV